MGGGREAPTLKSQAGLGLSREAGRSPPAPRPLSGYLPRQGTGRPGGDRGQPQARCSRGGAPGGPLAAFSPFSPPVPALPLVLLPLSGSFGVDFHGPFLRTPLEGAFPPGLRQAGPPPSHTGPDRTPRTAPHAHSPPPPPQLLCVSARTGPNRPCASCVCEPGSPELVRPPRPAPATLPGCSR